MPAPTLCTNPAEKVDTEQSGAEVAVTLDGVQVGVLKVVSGKIQFWRAIMDGADADRLKVDVDGASKIVTN